MSYGLLVLRAVVGVVLAAHGTQKLFGWWGGHGPRGTAGFFGSLGFRPALPMALLAGTSETAGALLALGLVTPLAALAVASVMVVAIGSVHWRNGLFNTEGGYEYPLVIVAAAVALAATGPGRFSLDRLIGWDGQISGLWWGVGVLVAAVAGGLLVVATREVQPEPEATDEPLARESADRELPVGR